jgi:glucan-binding YG repeat protein
MKKQTKLFTTLSAAALLTIGVSAVSMAAGWDNSTGVWKYLNNDGTEVTDSWKSANGNWFYLDSNGEMATNQLIEDNNNSKTRYYYVDQYGAMVTNTWKAVAMDSDDDLQAEYWWYYFGSDGKAYTSEDDLTTSEIKTINGLKYAFDSEGHMLYGWINKDNVEQQDSDDTAWETSTYYFNGWNDGHMQTGWIQLSVEDDDDTENYWFWFSSEGKKKESARKKINGNYYHFADDGHMLTDWAVGTESVEDAGGATASSLSFLNGDGAERKNKWVWAVPDEDYLEDDYNDDEYSWWYFGKNGKLTADTVKKINGKKYAFDQYGRMLVQFVEYNGSSVINYGDASDWTREEWIAGTNNDKYTRASDDYSVYYFSNNEEKDGAMKKGYVTLELDDASYQFYFNTSNGKGESGYVSKIKKYCKDGLVMAPTSDDDSNYAAVVLSGDDVTGIVFGSNTVGLKLVNNAGTVVKNKKKLKDNNDGYYVVSKDGIVLAYYASEDDYNDAITYTPSGSSSTKKLTISSDWLASGATPASYESALAAALAKAEA